MGDDEETNMDLESVIDDESPDEAEDVAQRLLKLSLAASQRSKAARLPSDDGMLIGVQDIELKRRGITVVPVGREASEDDRANNAYTFFKGREFQALDGVGNKTAKELDRELVYIKYDGNYYTKHGLWHAIKAPDGQQTTKDYRNHEFRTITTSLGDVTLSAT
ncbi:hypothetical protein ACVIRO_007163 [Rhizobium ruizarguesonis]